MARYLVEEEAGQGNPPRSYGRFDGLAVAKAMAQKKAHQAARPVIVRNAETGQSMAGYEPAAEPKEKEEGPSLANSVRRMRAANDRLKDALFSPGSAPRGRKRA